MERIFWLSFQLLYLSHILINKSSVFASQFQAMRLCPDSRRRNSVSFYAQKQSWKVFSQCRSSVAVKIGLQPPLQIGDRRVIYSRASTDGEKTDSILTIPWYEIYSEPPFTSPPKGFAILMNCRDCSQPYALVGRKSQWKGMTFREVPVNYSRLV